MCELLLRADGELEEFFGGLRADGDFGEFGPLAVSVDAKHGMGADLSQSEAPGHALALFEELHFGFEKTAVVESAHAIGGGFVVVGDNSESLEDGVAGGFCAADSFDDQDEAVEFVLRFFGLEQFDYFGGAAPEEGFAGPFANKKVQLFHGSALGFEVGHSG